MVGRKGSGKTALFFRVRDKIRANKKNIVLDLNPEGFQLRKFKTLVLDKLEEGTREHTITAFWEYLLLLEICYKILEKDRKKHLFDHTIRDQYIELKERYQNDSYVAEGDFAERLLQLVDGIEEKYQELAEDDPEFMTRGQITELIYSHDVGALKEQVIDYLAHKDSVWVLFDNLDKGWAAHGVADSDILSLRCLLDALRKLGRDLGRKDITARGVVFVRNDVFELLQDTTPDRGKLARVSLDWNDPELLRELLRRRFVSKDGRKDDDFQTLWNSIAVSHLSNGTESCSYLIERCLMRPRCLLDFLLQCKGRALNLGHERIEEEDILWAEEPYSTDLVQNIEHEINDVFPSAVDALYSFIESQHLLDHEDLKTKLTNAVKEEHVDKVIELLLWYGFIGILRESDETTYIYDVSYEMKKLKAISKRRGENSIYVVNKAFRRGLDIQEP